VTVLNAAEVARICGGRVRGDGALAARGFGADSRTLDRDEAFFAVRTGHDHVAEALGSGAAFAIVERPDALPLGATGVIVPDVVAAMGRLAADVRRRLDVRVVAITGSMGKTITKDLTAAALGVGLRVHAAPRSFNTDVTVPLVVLACPPDADVLVAELGARHPGEIADLCGIVRPDIGVLTGIGVTHLETFGSREAIARTKAELAASLPGNGLLVMPSTDDYLALLASVTDARLAAVGPGSNTRAVQVGMSADGRPVVRAVVDGREVTFRLGLPARALVRNALLALRVASELGVDAREAALALAGAATGAWRMEVREAGRRTIVNDAYNANPTSTAAALRAARDLASDRPAWAVLGEMAELGPIAAAEHLRIGRLARALRYDRVIAVGQRAAAIAEGAGAIGSRAADGDEAAALVWAEAPSDAVVLVKGSRVAGLEQVADRLTSNVSRAGGGA
jgi:UDP-N-acetylmuramoyl-tripeptide--D-alanyl-D-alanine ligase